MDENTLNAPVTHKATPNAVTNERLPDFQRLKEPERTLKRIDYLSKRQDLTYAERIVGIFFCFEFKDSESRKIIDRHKVGHGLSLVNKQVLNTSIKALSEKGLIQKHSFGKRNIDNLGDMDVEIMF